MIRLRGVGVALLVGMLAGCVLPEPAPAPYPVKNRGVFFGPAEHPIGLEHDAPEDETAEPECTDYWRSI